MTLDKLSDPEAVEEMLHNYQHDSKYHDLFINLVSPTNDRHSRND